MNISEIFETMEYGPAPESAAEAQDWLERHDRDFGVFIGGKFRQASAGRFESRNPATGERLAAIGQGSREDVDDAVRAARRAQSGWAALGGHGRAKYLYALARLVQKHSRLLAVLETLDNGKPIRESRDIDIPLVARHFYYHAGAAQLMETEMADQQAIGVAGQIIPWNFPLLMLAWKVAPAIAMGNTVVLKPAEYTSLSALMFAELCVEAGLPSGVVNIVTGDGTTGELIATHPGIDKVAFTGSTEVGRFIRGATAGSGKSLTLELGGKSPFIVFDDADLDSAVEGLVDAIWFNQGQVCCAGSRLLVQEAVADKLYTKIKARIDKLRVGNPLDKAIDVGAIVDEKQMETVTQMVDDGLKEGGTLIRSSTPLPEVGCYYPPTLITGLETSSRLMQEEIFGPVLVATTFRTPAEAVTLANNTRYGLAASIWTENINLALDIAPKVNCGVAWINSTNQFDAAAGFGGRRESGFGREGGREGLFAYTKPKGKPAKLRRLPPKTGALGPAHTLVDRTAKNFVGGKQARPDGGYVRPVFGAKAGFLGHVGEGNRKDIRNAVEAAHKAAGWAKTTGHLKAQIIYYMAENLSARAEEFADRLQAMLGNSRQEASEEVDQSISRLFSYAAWADKYDGSVHNVPIRGVALAMNEPVGVMGLICPDEAPLLGMISLIGPAIAMGNTCVVVPSDPYPLSATDFYQVLETSDVPDGVVNIVTGEHDVLAETLASHDDVDAVWYFGSDDISHRIEMASVGNLKRTWVNNGRARDWSRAEGQEFLRHATDVKNIWIPLRRIDLQSLAILERLIAFPTVSRDPNRDLIDWVASLLREKGVNATILPDADGRKANLYATIGPQDRPGVMLSGHTDVVPVDGQDWTKPPFSLTQENGLLYGRGTADMKGFCAAAIRLALEATSRELRTPLHLALSYDEEIGCMGVRSLIDMLANAPIRPTMCIVGEPTGMQVASGHKGKVALRAVCRGQEGHSALAPLAMNALHLAVDFANAIRDKQADMAATGAKDGDYDVPYTTLHIGRISGGEALNIVPNIASVDFEIRNLAEDDPAEIISDLRLKAAQIASNSGHEKAAIEVEESWSYPGLLTNRSSDVMNFVKSLTGANGSIKVAFGTEGGLFSDRLGIPTVICGPGSMMQGHKPDEFVSEDQMAACETMLGKLLSRLEEGL